MPRLRRVEVSEAGPTDLPSDQPPQRSRPRVPSRIVRISHSPPPPEVRVPARIVRVTPPNEVNPSQIEDDEVDPGALNPDDGEGNDPPLWGNDPPSASQATHQRGSRRSHKLHWKPPPPKSFNGDSKQDLNTWLGTVELYAHNAKDPDEEKAEMAAGYITGNAAKAFLNACNAAGMRCITDWDTFRDVLRSDFGQIYESHQARNKLEKLIQNGRADGYIRAFKNLVNQMTDDPMAQSDQVRFFYKGLKPHLQRDCKSDPASGGPFKSLERIMNHALSLEMSGDPKEGKDPTYDNKKCKNDSDDKSNKKGKSNSGRSKSTFYQEGSDELAYARENNLCLHCAKSGHITKECHHKKAGRPATPIVVSADWTRKGDGNRQVPQTLSSAQIDHELIA